MAEDIKFTDLKSIRLSRPCHASWKNMQEIEGNRIRHCHECDLHVYNLSEMSRREAVRLVEQHEGHLCVRFYRRRDGTILTRNCPVGVQAYNGSLPVKAWRVFCILADELMTRLLYICFPRFKNSLWLGGIDAEDTCPPDLQDILAEKQRERQEEIQSRLKELTEESLGEILVRQAKEADKEQNT